MKKQDKPKQISAADAAALKKAVESSEPIRVADYLLNLPISGLTGRERSELWNACAAFVNRVRSSGTQTGRISGAGPGNAKEVPSGRGKTNAG